MLWDRMVHLGLSEPALPSWQPDPSQSLAGVTWLAEDITGNLSWRLALVLTDAFASAGTALSVKLGMLS